MSLERADGALPGEDEVYAATAKLTDWAKEPTVTRLKEDLDASKPAHDTHVEKVQRWRDLMTVSGSVKAKKRAGRSSVQPKLIRRNAEWRYSALTEPFLSSDKLFEVRPVTFEDKAAAEQNELVLNYQIRTRFDRVRLIDEMVRTNVDEGSVIARVGWERKTAMVPTEVPVWEYAMVQSEEEYEALSQAIEAKQADLRGFDENADPAMKASVEFFEETGQAVIATQVGTETVQTEKILVNKPVVRFVAPENFYFDPSCGGDFEKANFVVESFETSKADLMKEGDRYKNLDRVNWEGATPLGQPDHAIQSRSDANFNFADTLRKRVVAYEYWGWHDIEGNGDLTAIVATWIGDVMIRLEENPYPDEQPPYVVESYMPIKREVMGEPDAELLEDNQAIIGAISRGMIDLLGRSANSQRGFAKGMLDVSNRRRYDNGEDYEYNPNLSPSVGLLEHKYPEIPTSALHLVQSQNMEAEALTGVKAFSGGISGQAYGDVATAVRSALDAAGKREMAILRRLASCLTKIGRKIIAMNGAFLSEEEVIRITNEQFVTVRREDLEGEFDLLVDISTAEIDEAKAADLVMMLQTMGNTIDFNLTKKILVEIAKLKRMPDLAKAIEAFEPQPDPLAEELKQLEIEMVRQQIENLRAEAAFLEARRAKTLTEANQNDLNTVEQETGTAHERTLEHQRAQSQGNQSLQITKALLERRKPDESRPDIDAAVGWNEISRGLARQNNRPAGL